MYADGPDESGSGMPPDEPFEIPVDGTLDLHAFDPRDVADLLDDYISECISRGIYSIRIIHGKGTGALRETVHARLSRMEAVRSFRLAGEGGGGWGATIAELKRSKDS